MTKTFAAAATLFAAVELFTCYYLWFDHDGSLFGEGTMAPGNFEGWRLARQSGRKWSSVERQLSFFSLWVGNNKFIFSALLLVRAGSSDGRTRLMASLSRPARAAVVARSTSSPAPSRSSTPFPSAPNAFGTAQRCAATRPA